jgi:hypothetical protein
MGTGVKCYVGTFYFHLVRVKVKSNVIVHKINMHDALFFHISSLLYPYGIESLLFYVYYSTVFT